jgi:hypothetical protein
MALAPTPLNPDHGLDKRPEPGDVLLLQRWIIRRYGITLPVDDVAEIIADEKAGSAVRHRLRWAFIHGRWVLFLSKNGRDQPQSHECPPLNGSTPYTWTHHVEGRRTPSPVYPGEPWDVDASFAHVVAHGPHSGVYWDASVETGFAEWAHERYGLPVADTLQMHLTARRHAPSQHRTLAGVLVGEMSPRSLPSRHITQLWLNADNVIVNRNGRELHVSYVPAHVKPKPPQYE